MSDFKADKVISFGDFKVPLKLAWRIIAYLVASFTLATSLRMKRILSAIEDSV